QLKWPDRFVFDDGEAALFDPVDENTVGTSACCIGLPQIEDIDCFRLAGPIAKGERLAESLALLRTQQRDVALRSTRFVGPGMKPEVSRVPVLVESSVQ